MGAKRKGSLAVLAALAVATAAYLGWPRMRWECWRWKLSSISESEEAGRRASVHGEADMFRDLLLPGPGWAIAINDFGHATWSSDGGSTWSGADTRVAGARLAQQGDVIWNGGAWADLTRDPIRVESVRSELSFSTDGGRRWQRVFLPSSVWPWRLEASKDGLFILAEGGELWFTPDRGIHWERRWGRGSMTPILEEVQSVLGLPMRDEPWFLDFRALEKAG